MSQTWYRFVRLPRLRLELAFAALKTAPALSHADIFMPTKIKLLHSVREDIASVFNRDPAAKNWVEVLLCYSGVHALWMYRVNHWFWSHGARTLARWLSQVARFLTGIEIHPAAKIGHRLFMDHGMGVVIGETTIIGDDVTMYQGVTLGGTGKEKGKRHPTIHDNVVIGAGAKVLGNITIGANCRIGAGSVVLRDVPENSTVVGVPGRIVFQNGKRVVIEDPKQINDPLSQSVNNMMALLTQLQRRVYLLESERTPKSLYGLNSDVEQVSLEMPSGK